MTSFHLDYFEQPEVWEHSLRDSPRERQRIQMTISAIPDDAETLLDAGCGSGLFLNSLLDSDTRNFSRLVGADISAEALKSVRTESHQSSIAAMPFVDRELDIVTCLEVLEHITVTDYDKTLREIARIAAKYILVTVPNRESLLQSLVICSACHCCFSPWFHVRSFAKTTMPNLFKGFQLEHVDEIGPLLTWTELYPIVRGAHLLWKRPMPPTNSICPQCYYSQLRTDEGEGQRLGKGQAGLILKCARKAKRLLGRTRKERVWLLALYARKDRC